LESSAIASIYDAMDSIDYDSLQSLDDLTEARDSVVEAVNEVASEYEGNEMYDINEDLQERVSILEGASSELENWEPEGEAPEDEKDCDECDGTGQVESSIDHDVAPDVECEQCEGTGKVENDEDLDEWLQEARESLQAAIDEMELP
jgi:RecJ-like exonuclease